MKKKYSHLINSLALLLDILIICLIVSFVKDKEYLNLPFLLYAIISWTITSYLSKFYRVYRFTSVYKVFSLLSIQFTIFTLTFFTYFGIFKEGVVIHNQFLILTSILGGIALLKFISFYALKKYRVKGMNYRNVVLIGFNHTSKKIIHLFNKKAELGYRYYGFFSDKKNNGKKYLGNINKSFNYILENEIDEIYCTISELKKDQIKEFTKFASQHSKNIKLIPNSNELYSKNVNAEYYENMLVLNIKKLPLEIAENRFLKRVFDVSFSLLIIVFIMSWLVPLLWVLIKLESKGSVLFKQEREGLSGYKFTCYKFRSMQLNSLSDKVHTSKNDARITTIGAFMRKTSIDELPQFFNVLKGDMSVVGPRPHMNEHSLKFDKEVANYMKRKSVRPGITGLAQISGYRGEIKKKSDIENRVRLDIFYIENWSFFLDIKITLKTIFNILNGEEKAY